MREEYYLRGMPKQALQVYLNNITDFVGPNGPQLISLDAPFSVIKAGIVSFKAKKICKTLLTMATSSNEYNMSRDCCNEH